jgi:hypothetical protein
MKYNRPCLNTTYTCNSCVCNVRRFDWQQYYEYDKYFKMKIEIIVKMHVQKNADILVVWLLI